MSVKTLLRQLAGEHGIEIDEAELEAFSGDEPEDIVELDDLPGTASGAIELFLAADSTAKVEGIEKDGLMWYPIIREGQWAVRPGASGQKKRVPLKVIAGKSKNQRREIGLEDIVGAFDDEAVQHVTVPTSHANTLVENQGFIDKLKISMGEVKDKASGKMKKVSVLMGGYRITEPDTKGKMQRGTYANRSAGLLYDYVNTDTGKTYPVVLEHVALTNKPWITGMTSFGRKLAGATKLSIIGLSLSDDGPSDDEYALALADEVELEDDGDFLAVDGATWDHETSPNWLRAQVCQILDEARSEKLKAQRQQSKGDGLYVDYNYPPNYRCIEAKPGFALIGDGYGDDSNFWVAPISVNDGVVELSDFDQWTASKKAYVPDDRPPPAKDKLPLDQEQQKGPSAPSRITLAREARRIRAHGQDHNNDTREVVEEVSEQTSTHQLSEQAQTAIQAAEAKAEAAEARARAAEDKIINLSGDVNASKVDTYVAWLKNDEKGLGLTEERGFSGVLKTVSELMLADDGEPAVQADCFADDSNSGGELTLSAALKRVFDSLHKMRKEGQESLGEQLAQPADGIKSKDSEELGEKGGDGGQEQTTTEGKPDNEETETELSTEDKKIQLAKDNPEMAKMLGIDLATIGASNGNGNAGGES